MTMGKSLDEQIDGLNDQIDMLQKEIDMLSAQRNVLLRNKRKEEIGVLYKLMKDNDVSIDDLYNMLSEGQQSA